MPVHPKQQTGFTLIELMIGIGILLVLVAILVNSYQTFVVRGQVNAGLALANDLKPAIAKHFQTHGVMPVNRAEIGLTDAAGETLNDYVKSVAVDNGRIDITYGNNANATIADAVLSIAPYVTQANTLIWRCGYATPPSDTDGEPLPAASSAETGSETIYGFSSVPPRYQPGNCR